MSPNYTAFPEWYYLSATTLEEISMPRHRWVVRLLLVATMLCCAAGSAGAQASLNTMLAPFLARYQLPALAAAVVKDGKVVAVGAVGTRKAGVQIPVTLNDRFHLGSDTKAMTALLAAMCVEAGKLRWDSTMAEVFPELAETMDQGLRHVTLEQFLSHTSGIPSDNDVFWALIEKSLIQDGNLDELRYWLVQQWSTQPIASEPGTRFYTARSALGGLGTSGYSGQDRRAARASRDRRQDESLPRRPQRR